MEESEDVRREGGIRRRREEEGNVMHSESTGRFCGDSESMYVNARDEELWERRRAR